MSMSWEQYDQTQEEAALGDFIAKIEAALQERNEGRNLRCWKLCSFGGKDADLDPEGCCGIDSITGLDDELVTVRVGGHKTFCDPSEEATNPELQASAQNLTHEIVCGAAGNGDWTGDDWCFSFREEVRVPYQWDDQKTDSENIGAIADLIIQKAEEACEVYGAS